MVVETDDIIEQSISERTAKAGFVKLVALDVLVLVVGHGYGSDREED